MTARPNRLAPTLLVVLAFVVGFWATLHSPVAALCVLSAAAVLFHAEELKALDEDFREATKDFGFCNAARQMGIDPGDLGKALKGEGGRAFDLRRVDVLPLPVRQRFYFLRSVRVGLPAYAATAARMVLASGRGEREVA